MIDWELAPEWAIRVGTLSSNKYWMNDNSYKAFNGNKRIFFTNYDSTDYECFVIIAARPKPESKPVYTQAMCDAGELPSVGMEVMIKNKCDAHPQLKKATIKYIGDLVIYSYVENGERCDSNINLVFRPLTPPIELIDGERYHFVHKQYGGSLGIYNSADEKFYNWDLWVMSAHCTDIQLLEVKS